MLQAHNRLLLWLENCLMKTDLVQKAVVLNPVGQMLILRRSETDIRRPNQWDLPGGMQEDGETFVEALVREIYEESGLHVSNPKLVFAKSEVQSWPNGEANVVRMYYIAQATTSKVIISNEHSEHKWVSMQQAIELIEYRRHREVLDYVLSHSL